MIDVDPRYLIPGMIAIEVAGCLSIAPPLIRAINRSYDDPSLENQRELLRAIEGARPYIQRICFIAACATGLWIGFVSGNNPVALLLFLGYRWLLTEAVKSQPTRQYWLMLAVTVWGCRVSAAASVAVLR